MSEDIMSEYDHTIAEVREVMKRLGMSIINRGPTTIYAVRFTMKRRWGGTKKYAYQCSLGTLAATVEQIERFGGKVVGIDS